MIERPAFPVQLLYYSFLFFFIILFFLFIYDVRVRFDVADRRVLAFDVAANEPTVTEFSLR